MTSREHIAGWQLYTIYKKISGATTQ